MVSKMRDQAIYQTRSQLGSWIGENQANYLIGMGETFLGPVLHPQEFIWFLSPTNIKGVRDLAKLLGNFGEIAGETLIAFEFPLAKLAKGVDALIKALEWCPPVPKMWKKSENESYAISEIVCHPQQFLRSTLFKWKEQSATAEQDTTPTEKNSPNGYYENHTFENLCANAIYITKFAGGILSVAIFGIKYVVPAVGRMANAGIDKLVALSASYGSIPLNALASGIRFVQKLGLDGVRSVLSFTFFSIECYEIFKKLIADTPETTDIQVTKTMDLITRLAKLSAIMIGTAMIFVPVTWPLIVGITTVGMIAAGLSLLTVFEKHRQEKVKKEQSKLILASA